MVKETAIKISKSFKDFLEKNKRKGEDFETTIKRLVNPVNSKELTKLTENKEGDKLMEFSDGLKVLIPRAEILLPMLENWSKRK